MIPGSKGYEDSRACTVEAEITLLTRQNIRK